MIAGAFAVAGSLLMGKGGADADPVEFCIGFVIVLAVMYALLTQSRFESDE